MDSVENGDVCMSGSGALIDMSTCELFDGCRRTAQRTEFSYSDYYREIERRTQHEHSRAIRSLTFWIAVLTVVATVATVISTTITVIR